jgi:RNA recognition motif-containing protein
VIPINKRFKKSLGFAFVEFQHKSSMGKVLGLEHIICGRKVSRLAKGD